MKMSTSIVKKEKHHLTGITIGDTCINCGSKLIYNNEGLLFRVHCSGCLKPSFSEFNLTIAIKGFNI